jgi:hypothetical protein
MNDDKRTPMEKMRLQGFQAGFWAAAGCDRGQRGADVAAGEAAQRVEQGSGRRCCALFAAVDLNQSGLAAASILITEWLRCSATPG